MEIQAYQTLVFVSVCLSVSLLNPAKLTITSLTRFMSQGARVCATVCLDLVISLHGKNVVSLFATSHSFLSLWHIVCTVYCHNLLLTMAVYWYTMWLITFFRGVPGLMSRYCDAGFNLCGVTSVDEHESVPACLKCRVSISNQLSSVTPATNLLHPHNHIKPDLI